MESITKAKIDIKINSVVISNVVMLMICGMNRGLEKNTSFKFSIG